MSVFEQFYDLSPVSVLDQNKWDVRLAEVQLAFRNQALYTPLLQWQPWQNDGSSVMWETELIPADIDAEEIPMTQNYIDAGQPFDSRQRRFTTKRFGDKVQLHKSDNIFQQWQMNGSRDWRPLLQGVLGNNIVRKHELLARNVWFGGPTNYWTYGGSATSIATIGSGDKFSFAIVNAWNLRLGNVGTTFIPGDAANAKVCYIPPGAKYDFFQSLPAASGNEASLFRDVSVYGSQTPILRYEIGTYKNIRFVETPNDEYGLNPNVLYNVGAISFQHAVTQPIRQGDGAPDPATTAVENIWYVGQKNTTHYLQLEDFATNDYAAGDLVTIHIKRTSAYGVTNGVDPLDTRAIVRRVVSVDATNNRLTLDRPIMRNFTAGFVGASVTGATTGTFYAYVTKGRHIGFSLVLGSREGVGAKVLQPVQFYTPVPIDDFESVWRFTWDAIEGYQVKEPAAFELHFFAVSLPKPGGIITP